MQCHFFPDKLTQVANDMSLGLWPGTIKVTQLSFEEPLTLSEDRNSQRFLTQNGSYDKSLVLIILKKGVWIRAISEPVDLDQIRAWIKFSGLINWSNSQSPNCISSPGLCLSPSWKTGHIFFLTIIIL